MMGLGGGCNSNFSDLLHEVLATSLCSWRQPYCSISRVCFECAAFMAIGRRFKAQRLFTQLPNETASKEARLPYSLAPCDNSHVHDQLRSQRLPPGIGQHPPWFPIV